MSRGVFGLPGKKKIKAYTKLTVVMFCQICDRRSVAPSSGDFRRRQHEHEQEEEEQQHGNT